ncbi:ABC transporter permease [Microbacterium pseudoresistens]|uniref:ABC-type dipeptide/oligopeptide/nickel transport system permease component n=1 Tax=Microbacterium pseudoresistens TaxID=640634 RepID=A0A7Y9ETS0_9MICO|nr:ABC transporter permease [Microbacterium pseudoresistens]NYD53711.1 ABC-type dipeptide/oligopeptide/nickel transport system permease component [Microbacterium pseudoresistens]
MRTQIRSWLTQLGGAVLTVLGTVLIAFILLRMLPGDPARLVAGEFASPEVVEAQARHMGLDQPIPIQFLTYIGSFLTGDWGFAYSAGMPVREILLSRFPASIELALWAFVFALALAVVLALVITYRKNPPLDGAVRGFAFLAHGVAPFWLALVTLLVFSQLLPVFPGPEGRLSGGEQFDLGPTGFYLVDSLVHGRFDVFVDALWHLVLPAIVLGIGPFSYLVRLLRANLLEVGNAPYITLARSKGIGRFRSFARHALPNALFPTLTASALIFAQLVAGSVLVESVFNWPGVGQLVVDSVLAKDYAVVQAFILLSAVMYVIISLALEFIYGLIDPRVRLRGN